MLGRSDTSRDADLPALAAALTLVPSAFAQQYHSNDLTPAGSTSGRLNAVSGGRQVGASQPNGAYSHAVLLSGNALTAVDLHPSNYYYSMAMCSDDLQQGGWGYAFTGGVHALVWNGSSASYADLNPSGYNFSYCLGVHGGEQVGYAQNQSYFVTASHAMSWHGSAVNAVDLHPAWVYPFSRAMGCRDGQEVGYVSSLAYPDGDSSGYHTTSRAVRWSGSAASAVDLHPVGYDASEATCTSGTQQGGWGYIATGVPQQHALLWSGDAASVVDLHPAGFTDSKITAMTSTQQVGEGWVGAAGVYTSIRHALLWTGTAQSVVDLNQNLPAGYTNGVATGIDAAGNVVGYAYNGGHPIGLAIPAGAIAVVFAPGAPPANQLSSIVATPSNAAPGALLQCEVTMGSAAPAGGVQISFLSSDPLLATTPAPILIPEGSSSATFSLGTGGTTLTAPATFKLYATDGTVSRSTSVTLTPVVKVAALNLNPVEGGFSSYATLSLNIPAQVGGASVSLTSGNVSLVGVPPSITVPQGYSALGFTVNTAPVTASTVVPVTASLNGLSVTGNITFIGTIVLPATVTVPQGAYSVTFTGTSTVVSGRKGVSLKATYNGSSVTTTVFVNPIPTVTITQADYLSDTKMFKVQATTTFTNAILTYGGSPDAPPIGAMQFELGVFKGSIVLDVAPTRATVWNSLGGMATVPVTIKTGAGGNSTGGGGGGGGGSTTTTYKLTVATSGKGTVTTSPSGTAFAPGTVVKLTATPAVGSIWNGWTGDITSSSATVSITINRDTKVTANFR